jgi:hypothetical protein
MQLSYSTLLLLQQTGDQGATLILRAWKEEAGCLWEPEFLRVDYKPVWDYYAMQVSTAPGVLYRKVIAPFRWAQVDWAPILADKLHQPLRFDYEIPDFLLPAFKRYSQRMSEAETQPELEEEWIPYEQIHDMITEEEREWFV